MPTLQEVKTTRDGLLVEMQKLSLGRFDAESRAKFDTMNADVAIHDADIVRLEASAKYEAEQRSAPKPTRGQPGQPLDGVDPESKEAKTAQEKRAFSRYITHGEQRDITTAGTGINGGALVPQGFEGVLHDAMKFFGPVSTLVGQKKTNNSGAPMKISLANDTGNTLTVLGETVAVSETDPSAFVSYILSTDTVTTGLVKVSLQELQDSAFDLDGWLRSKFGMRYGRGLEQMITVGNSSNVASLLASCTTVAAVGNGTAAGGTNAIAGVDGANSIGYLDIVNLYAALDPAYHASASFMMSSTVRAYLLGVKNTFGQPLFIPNPNGGAFDTLLGRPVVLNQAMPSIAANAKTVIFGDLSQGYLFRSDGDLTILRLNERYADTLEVGFIGYSRIGGIATDAGTHPLMVLVQSAT
jgi:HK97 family phage major capsid protein